MNNKQLQPIIKQFFPLLLSFVFITCCNNVSEPAISHYGQPEISIPGDDPYFVETQDTISAHGPHSITRNILQDRNGNIWLASWEGIICYDGKLFTNVTLKEGLKHFHVFSVLEDKEGYLWFGTIGGGVYRYNASALHSKESNSFILFTVKEGLAGNAVTCMLQDKTGNIWFGTDGGVSCYNPSAALKIGDISFTNFIIKENLNSKDIFSIADDKTGNIWFATRNDGVFIYDGKAFTGFTNKEGLLFNSARAIIQDKSDCYETGKMWIGSEDGLSSYNSASNEITNVAMGFVTYIFQDKAGSLWLSTGQNESNKFSLNGIKNNTKGGMALYRYNPSAALRVGAMPFSKIIEKNSSDNSQIFGVMEDTSGNIWFGTMNGVSCYDGKYFNDFSEKTPK